MNRSPMLDALDEIERQERRDRIIDRLAIVGVLATLAAVVASWVWVAAHVL